jgi:hypothetical protein
VRKKNSVYIKSSFGACLRDKQSEMKTGHRKEAFAAAKDRRNGQFSGVERRFLNPVPSFLLLFCGKKVEILVG